MPLGSSLLRFLNACGSAHMVPGREIRFVSGCADAGTFIVEWAVVWASFSQLHSQNKPHGITDSPAPKLVVEGCTMAAAAPSSDAMWL